jgi:hypothetical protein
VVARQQVAELGAEAVGELLVAPLGDLVEHDLLVDGLVGDEEEPLRPLLKNLLDGPLPSSDLKRLSEEWYICRR